MCTNAYLPTRLDDPDVVVAGLSDKFTIGIHSQLVEIRVQIFMYI